MIKIITVNFICLGYSFRIETFASTAGGLRSCNGAAFSPLEKFAAHFSNHAKGVTGEKEAPLAATGYTIQNSF